MSIDSNQISTVVLTAIVGGWVFTCIIFTIRMVKDFYFYYKNGWNFEKNSGIELYHGSIHHRKNQARLTNKGRVFFGNPAMLSIWLLAGYTFALNLLGRLV